MALTFGAATSDRVHVAASSSVNDLSAWTWVLWVYITTLTNFRHFFGKGSGVAGGYRCYEPGGGNNDQVRLDLARATTDLGVATDNADLTTNKWWCIAVTFDAGASAGELVHIYRGDLTAALTECTYGTYGEGAGAVQSDAGEDIDIANNEAFGSALQGRVAIAALFNRALSQQELVAWQFRPRVLGGCVGFWQLGWNGTGTQPDWSGNGNSGTVTGATVADHVPLGRWRRRGVLHVPSIQTATSLGGVRAAASLAAQVGTLSLGSLGVSATRAAASLTGRVATLDVTGGVTVPLVRVNCAVAGLSATLGFGAGVTLVGARAGGALSALPGTLDSSVVLVGTRAAVSGLALPVVLDFGGGVGLGGARALATLIALPGVVDLGAGVALAGTRALGAFTAWPGVVASPVPGWVVPIVGGVRWALLLRGGARWDSDTGGEPRWSLPFRPIQ
jgi:hypothetical protein